MSNELDADSRQYVYLPVSYRGGPVQPGNAPAELAIVNVDAEPTGWAAAEWSIPGRELRLMVGPGSPYGPLARGSYDVVGRLTIGGELIVRRAPRGLKVV